MRDRRVHLLSMHSLPNQLQRPELSWLEARIQELHPGLPQGSRVPKLWAILILFFRPQAGSCTWSGAARIRIGANMGSCIPFCLFVCLSCYFPKAQGSYPFWEDSKVDVKPCSSNTINSDYAMQTSCHSRYRNAGTPQLPFWVQISEVPARAYIDWWTILCC